MPIKLDTFALRKIFPVAPAIVIEAFVVKQPILDKAGITHTRKRLAYFFANLEHECGGFGLKGLTENINYTPLRAAEIWPSRFGAPPSVGANKVRAKYGEGPGWQFKMFDDVYGNRMGNRPGTRDGSKYIGRGGPQWTGRDGYAQVQAQTGLPVLENPELVSRLDMQPEICVAFWTWKKLNRFADVGDFVGCRKAWNGGKIGIADVEAKMRGNDPIIAGMIFVGDIEPILKDLPGSPPTKTPPPSVIADATETERKTRTAGTVTAGAGGAGAAGNVTATEVAKTEPIIAPMLTYVCIGLGVSIILVTSILIIRKHAAVIANWK